MNRLPPSLVRVLYRIAWHGARVYWRIAHPVTVGVRVVLVRDGSVILVRHTYRPGWYLPGGGVHRGETLEAAARRESREEAGAECGELRLLGVYTSFAAGKSDHIAVFASTDYSSDGRHDEEIAEVRAFALDSLPPDLGPGTRERIDEFLSGANPQAARW